MAPRKNISFATLEAMLVKYGSNYVLVAKELGITRQTVRARVQRSKHLQAAVRRAKKIVW